ncbi:MAG: sulfurtransferase [Coxiellaceae bacterium]|nr:MAG: sulfurtransferase [Coxiellaceae bacterium]
MQHSAGFCKLTQEAKQQVRETDIATIYARLNKGEQFYLIDVRESDEWQRGHLPNATHLSKGIIERDIEKLVPDFNAEIVLYCGGGSRSALAALNLQQMGYNNVISMDGGFRAWAAANYPINYEEK